MGEGQAGAAGAAAHPMEAEILAFILRGEGDFEALALRLFGWQRENNPAYGAMAGDHPQGWAPRGWQEIPAVPVDLFKDLDLACFPLDQPHLTFHTSGTTQGRPGAHHSLDTRLYDAGSPLHFRACVRETGWARAGGQAGGRIVSICPAAGGTSSLGHMLALFGEVEGFFDAARGVDAGVWARLRRAGGPSDAPGGGPVFLASTAFALDAMFGLEGPGGAVERAALTPESLVMVTGGFKGRRVRLDAPGLYAAIAERLGCPAVIGEYGMTELSSQLWTEPVAAGQVPGCFRAPPWLRAYAVDPQTGEPVAPGEPGLLRFVDLANCWSVLAVETLDLGVVEPSAGGDRVWLRGRLSSAEARGCSLTAEDFLSR